jgi:hypothetical protein
MLIDEIIPQGKNEVRIVSFICVSFVFICG